MGQVAFTGNDTQKINERILADMADGDVTVLDFPNELAVVKKGKNGNALMAFNAQGTIGDLTLRLVRGGADDKFMNNLVNQFINNPAAFVLLTGEFIKNIGDGRGNVQNDTYAAQDGVPMKIPPGKSNVDGDADQSAVVYMVKFATVVRVIA